GLVGSQFSPVYSMAKFGVVGFVRALAKRLAPDKIRVNAVCPGPIDPPMLRVFVARPDQQQAPGEQDKEALIVRRSQQVPMRRTGKPEEIANAALFLLSDEASFVSGAALPVDGAATAPRPREPLFCGFAGFDAVIVDRDPPVDAVFLGRVVAGRPVIGAAVIPDHDIPLAPFMAVFGARLDHVSFELGNQRIAFLPVVADDVDDLAGIKIERFAAGFRMGADDRVQNRCPFLVLLVEKR
ncbi:MAG: SDR family oxidoreductase, partial [Alphaproteobacteria bacterium]|nr:SDR family oxidoreductase [Alphaproteobacteria bacterium]